MCCELFTLLQESFSNASIGRRDACFVLSIERYRELTFEERHRNGTYVYQSEDIRFDRNIMWVLEN
jgi:hypothetical protein